MSVELEKGKRYDLEISDGDNKVIITKTYVSGVTIDTENKVVVKFDGGASAKTSLWTLPLFLITKATEVVKD